MARKRRHEEEDEMRDDDELDDKKAGKEDDEEDDDDGDDDDTIALDEAEEEEEDDDDVDDDDDEENAVGESVEAIERRRLFQGEAEDILENLTLDDVKEVLKENEMDVALAPRLKKLLIEVVNQGEVTSMDDAWEEAFERLED